MPAYKENSNIDDYAIKEANTSLLYTKHDALVLLNMAQCWYAAKESSGISYSGPFFHKSFHWNLERKVRQGAVTLLRGTQCCICSADLPKETVGDHMIATSCGGRNGIDNYLPMCKSCNSSKGKRDLVAWAHKKGHILKRSVLAMYTRLKYEELLRTSELNTPIDESTWLYILKYVSGIPAWTRSYLFNAVLSKTGKPKDDEA